MDYDAYEACFNTGDDAELVRRFFCDDVRFSGGSRDYFGKSELKAFLDWAHDGVREVMRPQLVIKRQGHLFAEVDMDFHATKERSDFPFGHLHPGDLMTVKFFVTYRLRDGRVAELKSMTWPPEKGVTKLPRLGSHPSQVAAFYSYVSAFSNADSERFPKFYADDVVLTLGPSYPTIHGASAIAEFYRKMFESVRESLTIHSLDTSDEAIRLDATSRFTAVQDAPDFVVAPLKQCEFVERRVIVKYELRGGLISRISVNRKTDDPV